MEKINTNVFKGDHMLIAIAQEIAQKGGRSFYTGGYARDYLINGHFDVSGDIDIEVFRLDSALLSALLSKYGEVKTVGKIYPILKIKGYPQLDFTAAGQDSYSGAAARRDFTIDAIMIDIISGEIMDHAGGRKDISAKIIRHISPRVFADDPLRAYRAARLAAKLGFTIHPETLQLMSAADLSTLPPERIYAELKKLLFSPKPSIGLKYLEKTGLLKQLHPILYSLIGCNQEPVNHPEGDVWEHTLLVVNAAAELKHQSQNPAALMWAALLHDIGKPATTRLREGRITAYGHDTEGAKLAASFLLDLRCSNTLIENVTVLIREHMHPILLYKQKEQVTDKAIRKLSSQVDISELLLLSEADFNGRGVKRDYSLIRRWLLDRLKELGLKPGKKIEPLIRGRDLLDLGMIPGDNFKRILDFAFELQLEGRDKAEIIQAVKAEYQ